jgi:hypothetical protein
LNEVRRIWIAITDLKRTEQGQAVLRHLKSRLPKRGNCYPFFGGTENSLSHVVAAQLIVELVSLIEMNTILILSLVILLFGFDSSSRNESIRFQRRVD